MANVSAYENALFDEAEMDEIDKSLYMSKQLNYILDINNGSYSGGGQAVIDANQISASANMWTSLKDSYLVIPYTIYATAPTTAFVGGASVLFTAFSAGIKNGSWSILNSVSVDYNGQTIHQQSDRINQFLTWKAMTQWTKSDLEKYGNFTGFWPDNGTAVNYQAAASKNGIGFCNNDLYNIPYAPVTGSDSNLHGGNDGILRRGSDIIATPTSGAVGQSSNGTLFIGKNQASAAGKSTYASSAAGANPTCAWNLLLKLRLKDLCSFFNHLPLVKAANMRITLNFNSVTFTTTMSATGLMTMGGYVQVGGQSNPILVGSTNNQAAAPALVTGGNYSMGLSTAGVVNWSAGVSISQVPSGAVGVNLPYNSVRLYYPQYALKASYVESLLTKMPVMKVRYEEVFSTTINNISPGSNFQSVISSGLANCKYMLMAPIFIGSASNTIIGGGVASLTQAQNCFDTAPSTTAPYCSLTNLQVFYGGATVFSIQESYDYSQFLDEMAQIYNFGPNKGESCGLLDFAQWSSSYRYYVVNLMRKMGDDVTVPKSISVSGTVNIDSAAANVPNTNINVFVVYARECDLDIETGLVTGLI